MDLPHIFGIDFGNKLAGTTVVAHLQNKSVTLHGSKKGENADQMILTLTHSHRPDAIYIDAPLSLPGVYQKLPDFHDYFYRDADRQVKAMSPMFLGGLTARAMKLSASLEPIPVFEVYPSLWAQRNGWKQLGYKKEKDAIPALLKQLRDDFQSVSLPETIPDWHSLDALLALYTGTRHQSKKAEFIGHFEEGGIYF